MPQRQPIHTATTEAQLLSEFRQLLPCAFMIRLDDKHSLEHSLGFLDLAIATIEFSKFHCDRRIAGIVRDGLLETAHGDPRAKV
jgi:hypothetical protein